jgi:hypothetical protein
MDAFALGYLPSPSPIGVQPRCTSGRLPSFSPPQSTGHFHVVARLFRRPALSDVRTFLSLLPPAYGSKPSQSSASSLLSLACFFLAPIMTRYAIPPFSPMPTWLLDRPPSDLGARHVVTILRTSPDDAKSLSAERLRLRWPVVNTTLITLDVLDM